MTKNELNTLFRGYVQTHLSPNDGDRALASSIYSSLSQITGAEQLLQIGSYPRYTAIHPLHDLDVLWILGYWDENHHNPQEALEAIQASIEEEFIPQGYQTRVSFQTHSLTIVLLNDEGVEKFSIDVVPAYVFGKNEFKEDIYKVPELIQRRHRERDDFYKSLQASRLEMKWIKSDPRGYIKVATNINDVNSDFRKAVKFVKGWKKSLSDKDNSINLKSFHLEQIITKYFQKHQAAEIFDAVFYFFCKLEEFIRVPQIPDRANNDAMIDAYIADMTPEQFEKILQAKNCFLVKLESFDSSNSVTNLIQACFYKKIPSEMFLFEFDVPTLIDRNLQFAIDGFLENMAGFRRYKYPISNARGKVNVGNSIQFRITQNTTNEDHCKWKVKNDNNCADPRGEITDYHTRHDPESAKYPGSHYVECYAIKDGVCIARSRQNVII
jgi:hypothetical protein